MTTGGLDAGGFIGYFKTLIAVLIRRFLQMTGYSADEVLGHNW